MWKAAKPMSLEDFISGAGCVTLFEELPGTSAKKFSEPVDKKAKTKISDRKGKRLSKPAKRTRGQAVASAPDGVPTDAAAEDAEQEPPPPAKKRRKKRAASSAVAGCGAVEGVPAAAADPSDVIEASGTDVSNWEVLHVPAPLLAGLAALGFEQPTEIQRLCLPAAIRGRMDLVGAAETGSGKTLAFALPLLYGIMKLRDADAKAEQSPELDGKNPEERQDLPPDSGPKALVLAPTRELAIQVKNHIVAVAKYTGVKVVSVVGGMSEQKQQRLLSRRPEVVVATPGRLWEFVEAGDAYLSHLSRLRFLVVDETDRMLEKGHFQQLHLLLERINADKEQAAKRQNFVFSATLTMGSEPVGRDVKKLKSLSPELKLKHITSMIGIRANNRKLVDITRKAGTAETLTEMAISCSIPEKDELLYYFCLQHPGRTLVFCNSIDCVTRLGRLFSLLEMSPLLLHSSQQQRQRLKSLQRFQAAPAALLVATDVAARGLDVPGVQHVIHYQVPRTPDAYVHRSGRTARAHAEGLSVMLVEPGELAAYRKLLRQLDRDVDLPPFDVDSDVLPPLAAHVRLARQINLAEHRLRRDAGARGWQLRAAEQMDLELDSDLLPERDEEADRRAGQEIRVRRHQLRAMLAVRSAVWTPRTQHGRLRVPVRNVSALEVAKKSKKKKQNGGDAGEDSPGTPPAGSAVEAPALAESVTSPVAPPEDSGHVRNVKRKKRLAAGPSALPEDEEAKRRLNAKQRRKKKWFARKGNART